MTRNAEAEERDKLDLVLCEPPEGDTSGIEAPGWSREEQMAAFNSF